MPSPSDITNRVGALTDDQLLKLVALARSECERRGLDADGAQLREIIDGMRALASMVDEDRDARRRKRR